MKKSTSKYFKLLVLLLIVITSCKKTLNITPQDSFGSSNFWQNDAQATNFMVGLHNQFRSNQFQFLRLGELRGGGLSTVEIFPVSLNEVPLIQQNLEENASGVGSWAGFYGPILQLNLFIQKLKPLLF